MKEKYATEDLEPDLPCRQIFELWHGAHHFKMVAVLGPSRCIEEIPYALRAEGSLMKVNSCLEETLRTALPASS